MDHLRVAQSELAQHIDSPSYTIHFKYRQPLTDEYTEILNEKSQSGNVFVQLYVEESELILKRTALHQEDVQQCVIPLEDVPDSEDGYFIAVSWNGFSCRLDIGPLGVDDGELISINSERV